jgi:hypothetical protein
LNCWNDCGQYRGWDNIRELVEGCAKDVSAVGLGQLHNTKKATTRHMQYKVHLLYILMKHLHHIDNALLKAKGDNKIKSILFKIPIFLNFSLTYS